MSATDLARLAELIREKNVVDRMIASIVGRPALVGHVGEYVAAEVFDISLERSASRKSIDGHFRDGPLAGCTVNIKWYAKLEGLLDITPDSLPDYYLVLTGPKSGALSSRGTSRPWVIESVFLFRADALAASLRTRGVKIGIATSVTWQTWGGAEVYPTRRNMALVLSEAQRAQLALFSGS